MPTSWWRSRRWITSVEPIVEAVRRLEPLAQTATLASVLDAEDANTKAGRAAALDLEGLLVRCGEALVAKGLVEPPVEHQILYGRPADELARFADAGGFRAIVFGPDAPWTRHLVQGHIRARLQRLTEVPVFPVRRSELTVGCLPSRRPPMPGASQSSTCRSASGSACSP